MRLCDRRDEIKRERAKKIEEKNTHNNIAHTPPTGVGSLVEHTHSAPWRGSGRDWPLARDPVGIPAGGVAAVPPFGVRAIAVNMFWHAVEAVLDVAMMRGHTLALNARHGVDLATPAARARSALFVVNSDAAWEHARRLPPGVVLAGSLLSGPGEPLPPAEAAWLAAAAARGDRVVYFALGTMFQLPPGDALDLVARMAAMHGVAVLARLTDNEGGDDAVAALPADRARVMRWAPQNDLLASGIVSLFITHGGASSIGEPFTMACPCLSCPKALNNWTTPSKWRPPVLGWPCYPISRRWPQSLPPCRARWPTCPNWPTARVPLRRAHVWAARLPYQWRRQPSSVPPCWGRGHARHWRANWRACRGWTRSWRLQQWGAWWWSHGAGWACQREEGVVSRCRSRKIKYIKHDK